VRRFLRRFGFSFGLLTTRDKTQNQSKKQSGEGIAALQTKTAAEDAAGTVEKRPHMIVLR